MKIHTNKRNISIDKYIKEKESLLKDFLIVLNDEDKSYLENAKIETEVDNIMRKIFFKYLGD